MSGEVYLVGGGPGDPGLLTCRGKELLEAAEVVIYDRLIETALLNHTRDDCELIYAGKKPGEHKLTQTEINELMVKKAREDRKVVRLKGGDPFLFGRGGEEAAYLNQHDISFQVVPGITSALSVPAYAGVPATTRGKASSLAVITGHEDPDKDESSHNWDHLALGPDTLIFLMGVGNLPRICRRLIAAGRDENTPVALIERGTCPEQRSFISTLKAAGALVREDCLSPPAVIVVGEVVGEREDLVWRHRRPLSNLRILNTRPSHQSRELTRLLAGAGAVVREAPAIKISPPDNQEELDLALKNIEEFDWIVFTSQNGVQKFFARLQDLEKDIRELAGIKLAAIGQKTAEKLQSFNLRVDFVPAEFVAEEVLSGLLTRTDKDDKILLPRTPAARSLLYEGLNDAGRRVKEVSAYKTEAAELPTDVKQSLEQGEFDLITFTSSSTVTCLWQQLDDINMADKVKGAAIGPITAETAAEKGIEVTVTAEQYTARGLFQAIREKYSGEKSGHA